MSVRTVTIHLVGDNTSHTNKFIAKLRLIIGDLTCHGGSALPGILYKVSIFSRNLDIYVRDHCRPNNIIPLMCNPDDFYIVFTHRPTSGLFLTIPNIGHYENRIFKTIADDLYVSIAHDSTVDDKASVPVYGGGDLFNIFCKIPVKVEEEVKEELRMTTDSSDSTNSTSSSNPTKRKLTTILKMLLESNLVVLNDVNDLTHGEVVCKVSHLMDLYQSDSEISLEDYTKEVLQFVQLFNE